MAVSITPLSKNIGAEVTGVVFSQPLTAADLADIKQALLDHLVMVVRDQSLDPKQLLAATRLFGETMEQHLTDTLMDGHPEIAVLDSSKMPPDKQGRVIPFGARTWHTDHTNHEHPPKYTALYAINLPASGGDTSFANMNFGYTALPREEQASLLDLQTVNKIEDFGYIGEEARVKFGTLPVHPLIRTHPETGKKALYVHPGKLE
ncbi:MAG: TauD/TfdA family dioxygenase, partial [Pseudomonadota bacterium]|nr:TauD/TfdA family dioxygenase [Pseudomonadota bacterium]